MKPTNPTKQCLNNAIRNQMLAEIQADKEKAEQIADVIAMGEVLPEHQQIVAEIVATKPCSCPYHRGENQMGCSRRNDPAYYQAVMASAY